MAEFHDRIAELDKHSRELAQLAPDAIKAFGTLSREAQKAGAVDHKTKELIGLHRLSRPELPARRRHAPGSSGGACRSCADGRRAQHGAFSGCVARLR